MLRCMPSAGSSTKPAVSEPSTAPPVFARYRAPARCPTAPSVSWSMALAIGNVKPIISAGTPSSSTMYFSTIQSCTASACHGSAASPCPLSSAPAAAAAAGASSLASL